MPLFAIALLLLTMSRMQMRPMKLSGLEKQMNFGVCIKGNDALTEKIDLALDKLFAEGKIQAISKEIFGSDIVSATRAN